MTTNVSTSTVGMSAANEPKSPDLITRIESAERGNDLDVLIEIAAFEPCRSYRSVRANSAGTKVIYTRHDGTEETCLAWDWTLNASHREQAVSAILKAKGAGG